MKNTVIVCGMILALPFRVSGASKAEQSAFGVVKAFYEAANRRECAQAEDGFTAESLKTLKETLASAGGFQAFCQDRGGKAPLADVRLVKAEIKKGVAEVMTERTYSDGSSARAVDHLVKQGGAWKIEFQGR
ncbi:MAG TPA: hypothetical protein VN083_07525 [Vicinamibacteria bacterium]|jgi:hypothetical protein|nr:hypothetical protein [Vicinamibacteria bacterium]